MKERNIESSAKVVVDLNEKIRVLYIDDDSCLLKTAKQCLEMGGPFQVDTALSVEEAVTKLKKKEYDVVVSDYKMSIKNSLDFLRELRREENQIPSVIFTGNEREEVAIRAMNLKADQYRNKTADPATVYCELAHNIRQAVARRRAEEKTRESRALLASVFDTVADGVAYLDTSGKIITANKRLVENMLGYKMEEIVGLNFTDLGRVEPKEHSTVSKMITDAVATGNQVKDFKVTLVRKDGRGISTEVNTSILKKENRILGIITAIRDITERKKAEDDLRQFSTAVRTSLDGIVTGDLNGNISDVNDAVLTIYGSTNKGDLIGKNVLDFLVERDRTRALQDSLESIRTEQGKTIEYTALTKDGAEIPIEITTAFIRDEQSEPIGFVDIIRNIAERKKAELELQLSERKYRELANQLPQIVYEIDRKGRFTFVNEKGFELTGYSHEDVEKGLNILQTVAAEDRSKAEGRIQRAQGGERADYTEYSVLKKDGSTFPAIACVSAIVREGKIVGLRGIVVDITERKKMEERLRDSEEKFRNLAEQSPNMIFINLKGRVVYVNKEAEDAMGYKKEEYYSPDFNFLDLIAPESRESVESAFRKHIQGEDIVPYEYKLITKEGRTIDAIINSRLTKYDGEPAILGVVTDITDLRKAERMTLESQQNFKALFMGNPEAAAHLAPDFHIIDINPRFEELFGYSPAETKGRHINNVVVQTTKMEEAETLDKNAIKGYVYHDTVRKRKDGSLVPVAVSAAPITVEGRPAGYVAMYKDISDLKNAEKKLEAMNEKLRVVSSLTRHDVRNKLSVVTGNAYLLMKKLNDDPEALELLDAMECAVEQITRIFDFVTCYERLGIEKLVYMDVEETIDEAVSLFSDLHNVQLVNDCAGLTVLADSLLRQLFYNFIDNSLKYGEKTTRIRIHYKVSDGGQIRLIYEDDGVGISDDLRKNLFKEGVGRRTGYGLFLIKRMIEVYGWAIQETGKRGKGAQFTITIPEKQARKKPLRA
jgi:PAS domain S-box-containing protein